jgi:predicted AAA+ superfamily ATPase
MIFRLPKLSESNSFFLFGARGTGKTSLVKERFLGSTTLYLDLLQDAAFEEYNLTPGLLEQRLIAEPYVDRIIIDEVQRVPALLNEVHRIIELYKQHQFILTGSSSRKLKRGGANLLAGRAWVYHLFPLTSPEFGELFDLTNVLSWGGLPKLLEICSDDDKREYLRAYTSTYLREEILQEQILRELRPFQRFLPIAAQSSGDIINYSAVAREVGVTPPTIEGYFQILEDTLLGLRLPAYHQSLRKQERLAPKFYLFDIGITRSLLRQLHAPPQPGTYSFGKLFEQFVILEIIRLSSYQRRDDAFFYYRTQGGLEVDLVIDRSGEDPIFIEIKSTERILPDHTNHLERLAADHPKGRFLCFSLEKTPRQIGPVRALHWQDGLRELGLRS